MVKTRTGNGNSLALGDDTVSTDGLESLAGEASTFGEASTAGEAVSSASPPVNEMTGVIAPTVVSKDVIVRGFQFELIAIW